MEQLIYQVLVIVTVQVLVKLDDMVPVVQHHLFVMVLVRLVLTVPSSMMLEQHQHHVHHVVLVIIPIHLMPRLVCLVHQENSL